MNHLQGVCVCLLDRQPVGLKMACLFLSSQTAALSISLVKACICVFLSSNLIGSNWLHIPMWPLPVKLPNHSQDTRTALLCDTILTQSQSCLNIDSILLHVTLNVQIASSLNGSYPLKCHLELLEVHCSQGALHGWLGSMMPSCIVSRGDQAGKLTAAQQWVLVDVEQLETRSTTCVQS